MMPLYGFLQGDTMGLLVLAREDDTVAELAHQLRQSARVRVTTRGSLRVLHAGRQLDPRSTLKQAGLKPLDRFDVEQGP